MMMGDGGVCAFCECVHRDYPTTSIGLHRTGHDYFAFVLPSGLETENRDQLSE